MSTNREPPRAGDVIGRQVGGYSIDSLIGEGGMGAVYACSNARLGRRAALKVIAGEYTQRRDIVDRFFREARAVAAVDDPNIIDIYDAAELTDGGPTYILMPFIAGESLESLCEQNRTGLPLDIAATIALQIASGLDAVHAVGIVHRDIKPANILVSRRQRRRYFVTIVDFGIAKLLDPMLAEGFRTRTRSVIGTAGYMAPEQARGDRDVDGRADVYSLATVLYRMLTGRRPYTEASLYGVIEMQIRNAPFPRPRSLRAEIPAAWEDAILESLQVDRARRPGSVKELAQRLAAALPNGDELLRVFAPRLRPDATLAPTDATLSGDLEGSLSHARALPSSSVTASVTARLSRARALGTVIAVVGSALAGAIVTHWLDAAAAPAPASPLPASSPVPGELANVSPPAASSLPAAATVARADAASGVSGLSGVSGDVSGLSGGASDASGGVSGASGGVSGVSGGVSGVSGGVSGASGVSAAPAAPEPTSLFTSAPPGLSATAEPPGLSATAEPPGLSGASGASSASGASDAPGAGGSSAAAQTGTLIVKVRPYAEVMIDGEPAGTTPVRRMLRAGTHRVVLVGANRTEVVTVQVGATRLPTIVSKTW